MKLAFKISGASEVKAVMAALAERAPEALDTVLNEEADELMRESLTLVPIDTGELYHSIYKRSLWQGTRRLQVEVGYETVYALITHENPRSGQTGGVSPSGRRYSHWARTGQWKYLEQPFLSRMSGYRERLQAELYSIWLGD